MTCRLPASYLTLNVAVATVCITSPDTDGADTLNKGNPMKDAGFSGHVHRVALLSAALVTATVTLSATGQTAELSSPWHEAHMSQVRLIAARRGDNGQDIVAGIQVALQPGWKTYWRNPGDAGGVPPEFDWSGSGNVANTEVLYPAPKRFRDPAGETIGYKGNVVMPVLVRPADPDQDVELRVKFNFGICADICVPVEQELTVNVPRQAQAGLPSLLQKALDLIPRSEASAKVGDPKLVQHEVHLSGDQPRILLDVDFGSAAHEGDVFAEASDDFYLPMPARMQEGSTTASRFEIDLREADDVSKLKGKTIRLTLVGAEGQSEATFVVK
ncbi:Thiol-disulfide interchange protein, contains DsbC and DsbD domains [Filomicrobium insigne]|uniref:Thiol-disulfide interchange protein, contains DsbC and DsbD domains n=2 Tax=Filomicrobium insigne TaxID=418854 RepID=A0A1H0MXT7_9HYPH|nr:Thiol-disulfide interchange protein, contains DsbC and DsbD domains [Filomicrobium insigne]